jgi:cytochrome c biogenesis protein CcdA
MFERISYTWELMGASWAVLKRDKTLVLFPLFSACACILVLASFIMPLFVVDHRIFTQQNGHFTQQQQILGWAYLFGFYFVNYFVITFFNVGIVSSAVVGMAGGTPSFSGGIQAAMKRIHLIAGWALVSATVGLLLKLIESYNRKFGRFISGLLGAAWTILTFLVVPVLVVENKGPIDALKESASLLKKTWGTQVVGNFSFGLIFALLFLPGMIGVFASFYVMGAVSTSLGFVVLGMAITYIIALALVQSALHSIFQAAVYMYTQGVPDETRAFPVKLLRDSMYDNG